MYSIYKYPLELTDEQNLKIPRGAKFLCIKEQNDIPVTYWLVNLEEKATDNYKFNIFGTGQPTHARELGNYVGTVVCRDGRLVWHIFSEPHVPRIGDL